MGSPFTTHPQGQRRQRSRITGSNRASSSGSRPPWGTPSEAVRRAPKGCRSGAPAPAPGSPPGPQRPAQRLREPVKQPTLHGRPRRPDLTARAATPPIPILHKRTRPYIRRVQGGMESQTSAQGTRFDCRSLQGVAQAPIATCVRRPSPLRNYFLGGADVHHWVGSMRAARAENHQSRSHAPQADACVSRGMGLPTFVAGHERSEVTAPAPGAPAMDARRASSIPVGRPRRLASGVDGCSVRGASTRGTSGDVLDRTELARLHG